ncbi:nucleoside triphosphate pyrophosphohydrolase [Citromicrobium phage vB_CbaS-RXM]|nr:nucleoside triphosphate pyrophosphohydrolase [Citromicrobium phage vB_CbaS-RXM]
MSTPATSVFPPASFGYHKTEIARGEFGEVSKIDEELAEFKDALAQDNPIMALVELSDLLGAVEGWMAKHTPAFGLDALIAMNAATKRSFASGQRAPKTPYVQELDAIREEQEAEDREIEQRVRSRSRNTVVEMRKGQEPVETTGPDRVIEVVVRAPAGGGKTTAMLLFEAMFNRFYHAAEPSPVRRYADEGFTFSARHGTLPDDRHLKALFDRTLFIVKSETAPVDQAEAA